MNEKFFQYHSSKIFYRIVGKGRPVILIHGFGEDGDIWQKQIEFLKDQFQLIIPDLPGSGKSELVKDADIETYSEIIKAIIVEEDIEICTMLGHSLGGYITLAFAEKYPGLLHSFGLVHSSAFADSEEKKAARLKAVEFIKKNGAYEFLKATIRGLFGEHWSKDHQPEIDALIEKSKSFTNEAVIQYYRAMISRPDRTHVLKTFPGPILFIIGRQDNAVPFQQSLQQCYLPWQSHVHIFRLSAHMGMWEETDKADHAMRYFIISF
jgi:pimeloyl-ACP methyl ester carboxylesterase